MANIQTLWGVGFILVGPVIVYFAYRLAKIHEQFDAIGSKRRSSEIEPASWKVLITRIIGGGIILIGLILIVDSL